PASFTLKSLDWKARSWNAGMSPAQSVDQQARLRNLCAKRRILIGAAIRRILRWAEKTLLVASVPAPVPGAECGATQEARSRIGLGGSGCWATRISETLPCPARRARSRATSRVAPVPTTHAAQLKSQPRSPEASLRLAALELR